LVKETSSGGDHRATWRVRKDSPQVRSEWRSGGNLRWEAKSTMERGRITVLGLVTLMQRHPKEERRARDDFVGGAFCEDVPGGITAKGIPRHDMAPDKGRHRKWGKKKGTQLTFQWKTPRSSTIPREGVSLNWT